MWTPTLTPSLTPEVEQSSSGLRPGELTSYSTVYIQLLTFCAKAGGYVNKNTDVYKRTCLFADKLSPFIYLFFLFYACVLWQKVSCSFYMISYSYLHAIVFFFFFFFFFVFVLFCFFIFLFVSDEKFHMNMKPMHFIIQFCLCNLNSPRSKYFIKFSLKIWIARNVLRIQFHKLDHVD